jgi:HEAT repeats
MAKGIKFSLAWALLGAGMASTLAIGQVVDIQRDTKLTGPRGRTIERDVNIQRGPGYVDRQVEIKRPGETLIRDTRVQTFPGGGGYGRSFAPGYFGGGPRYFGGPRFVQNVIVPPAPIIGGFVGLPALNFAFGGGGGGGGGGGNPGPGQPQPPPQPPAFDAFADAIGRLKSFHAHSRRDGALTLGRIGDPRAVPALNERLEHDFDKDVRVAAAWALGEIGDERGAVALERAVLSEKHHHEVRDAATEALKKLPKPGQPSPRKTSPLPTQTAPAPTVIQGRAYGDIDPGPNPVVVPPGRVYPEDQPPPPPVPATLPPPTPNPSPATSPAPALEPPTTPGPFGKPS